MHSSEGLLVLDADRTVLWVNDTLLSLIGRRREVVLEHDVAALAGDAAASGALFEAIGLAIGTRPAHGATTVPVLRDDGQVLLASLRVYTVDTSPGASVRWVVALEDVTERRQLEHALATVADEERQGLARDVGTGLGAELVAARAALAVALGLAEETGRLREALLRAETTVERAAAMANAFSQGILPLQRGASLVHALEVYADNMSVPGAVSVVLTSRLARSPVGNEADQLYRICQEAVANAIRHAHARLVSIVLEPHGRGLKLAVSDDGSGFAAAPAVTAAGKGFRMMRLRAASVGARLEVTSAVGRGTSVTCTLGD
jgi:PAS domain S-box-containing protein